APRYFLLLWIPLLIVALLLYAHSKRRRAAGRFADHPMLVRLQPVDEIWRGLARTLLLLLGVSLLVVAVARPRWGVYYQEIRSRGVDMFVLLDVSRSMSAQDVRPSRLERAKSDIRDLLARVKGDRVGLIVFAGASVVKVPLTTDQGFFEMVLDDIDIASAPRGGSLVGDAIRKALVSMPEEHDRDQVLVLITDGEDHDSFPDEAAKAAAARGIKIFTLGLGDVGEGNRIPLRDENGSLRFLQHDGQEVWSRLDEGLLKSVALATGGAYIPGRTSAYDLGQIYEDHLASLAHGSATTERRRRYREQFQWFLAFGLGCLLLEMAISRYPRDSSPRTTTEES
ncbi:MAG: VWA domain-containing protein, partial [Pirellulaceae bacterium]|nr:VWA domain-containing protein [Pirellulaceae bacterium]